MDEFRKEPKTSISKLLFVRVPLYLFTLLLGTLIVAHFAFQHLDTPPSDFPVNTDILIEEGSSQKAIALMLTEKHIIRSSLYLQFILTQDFGDAFIQAGVYRFTEPVSSTYIASMLTKGLGRSPAVSITLPEGFRAQELYSYLPEPLKSQEKRDLASYEGYLFPDTYFISQDMTFDGILALLTETREEKLKPYQEKINNSGFSEREVMILASIIEREAKDTESKKIVSGILQNRLRAGMPLQVDATFDYILGKASHELTEADLEIDSPFNTYNNKGLPPAPISNPGLASIEAVLEPTNTEYLYYLTGDDGVFYYALTFEAHKQNKARYLR